MLEFQRRKMVKQITRMSLPGKPFVNMRQNESSQDCCESIMATTRSSYSPNVSFQVYEQVKITVI